MLPPARDDRKMSITYILKKSTAATATQSSHFLSLPLAMSSSSVKKKLLSSLISAIKSSDRTKTKNLSDDITFDINSSVECESDGEEDFPLQVALGNVVCVVIFLFLVYHTHACKTTRSYHRETCFSKSSHYEYRGRRRRTLLSSRFLLTNSKSSFSFSWRTTTTTTTTDEHFTKQTEDSFACFSTICSHDHLNPDKDFWGDGKTALQRAAERCDAYASFALLERKASVEATNRRDGNKTAIDYARGMKVTSEEEKENKNRVIRLLESERDGTDAGLERFLKRLEEVRLPNEDAE
jgi:hypothetical protein